MKRVSLQTLLLLVAIILPFILSMFPSHERTLWAFVIIVAALLVALISGIFHSHEPRIKQKLRDGNLLTQPRAMPLSVIYLLKLMLLSNNDQNNIIGDLLEEYLQFNSKLRGYLWLYKQLIKSASPLIYKALKRRLAARFGERIR
jgi:hypothetical protein